ncbi:MAG: aminodeoxychorismate lyase [Methylohalobius sp.]|nr:aminodeoxychorismate lyase [Methylohalobius sp.]
MAEASVWVNGRATSHVEVADRGFQYGDGLFETFLVHCGVPVFWQAHLERLKRGCERLGILFPDPDRLRQEAEVICAAREQGVLKLALTRGIGGRGYAPPKEAKPTQVFSFHSLPANLPQIQRGVKVRACRTHLGINPDLAGIKHLNRLEQVLARREWDDPSIYEGLMCDWEGWLVEGIMTNLFWRRDGILFTPRLDRCGVAGIARAWVLERAAEWGIEMQEVRVGPRALAEAEEVFLTNSVVGIVPVVELVNGGRWAVGPLVIRLQDRWQRSLTEAAW